MCLGANRLQDQDKPRENFAGLEIHQEIMREFCAVTPGRVQMTDTGRRDELSMQALVGPALRLALGLALCVLFLATVCGMALVA